MYKKYKEFINELPFPSKKFLIDILKYEGWDEDRKEYLVKALDDDDIYEQCSLLYIYATERDKIVCIGKYICSKYDVEMLKRVFWIMTIVYDDIRSSIHHQNKVYEFLGKIPKYFNTIWQNLEDHGVNYS